MKAFVIRLSHPTGALGHTKTNGDKAAYGVLPAAVAFLWGIEVGRVTSLLQFTGQHVQRHGLVLRTGLA